ncbi:putative Glycoside hydrolase [Blattamonas nauphoetae]|uniref:Chitinase domain-containing protein 1 n=1 Tax=Blattamonas nauphoetae TaxID=2049346 RepID=A0ABQ9WXB7_9EUKA|nr:putative Glycoside hydrolase [Blattamonas nauphoetae]
MAYVTPWNKAGWQLALDNAEKLDVVVPVWYQVKPGKKYRLMGKQDVNKTWIEAIHKAGEEAGRRIKVIPRFYFEKWTSTQWIDLLNGTSRAEELRQLLFDECIASDLDGVLLDFASLSFASYGLDAPEMQVGNELVQVQAQLYQILAQHLHLVGKEIIVVTAPLSLFHSSIPYVHPVPIQYALHRRDIDAVMVMTYDYSGNSPGPISPSVWAKGCVESLLSLPKQELLDALHFTDITPPKPKQIFMGMNFYGTHFKNGQFVGHVRGDDVLKILSVYKTKIDWESNSEEHRFTWREEEKSELSNSFADHTMYYPTIHSITKRKEKAESIGCGLAIWELGQGLPYFMDVL